MKKHVGERSEADIKHLTDAFKDQIVFQDLKLDERDLRELVKSFTLV